MVQRTCSIDGCRKDSYKRGWCVMHYRRWQKHGDPNYVRPARIKASCVATDCSRDARAAGYCNRHYENLRRYGDPIPRKDRPLETRLHETGWTITEADCWEWNGKRNDAGYGIFDAERHGYEGARAHRVMYERYVEPLPDELILRHHCDNPPCVNPKHLIPGTPADNVADMMERGRHWRHGRTECDHGHDLTLPGATQTIARPRGPETVCAECARDRRRRHAARKQAS